MTPPANGNGAVNASHDAFSPEEQLDALHMSTRELRGWQMLHAAKLQDVDGKVDVLISDYRGLFAVVGETRAAVERLEEHSLKQIAVVAKLTDALGTHERRLAATSTASVALMIFIKEVVSAVLRAKGW